MVHVLIWKKWVLLGLSHYLEKKNVTSFPRGSKYTQQNSNKPLYNIQFISTTKTLIALLSTKADFKASGVIPSQNHIIKKWYKLYFLSFCDSI